jgi:hypothetical protein
MTEEILGYVICADAKYTGNNSIPEGIGTMKKYLGRNYTLIGLYGFRPYVTEKGAETAKKTWEKRFKHPAWNNGWEYTIGNVIPLTKQNIKQFEAEAEAQLEIVQHMLNDNISKK